jgi:hypothetical protein
MRHLSFLLLGVTLMFAAGCATLVRGDKQAMKFVTDPPGATVLVDGAIQITPATVQLKRNEEHPVTISLSGYRSVTFVLKSTWDGASLPGVILPGGSASVAADRASGADLNFYDLPKIKLEPAMSENTPPLEMVQYRKQLLTKTVYDKVMEEERQERMHSRPGE